MKLFHFPKNKSLKHALKCSFKTTNPKYALSTKWNSFISVTPERKKEAKLKNNMILTFQDDDIVINLEAGEGGFCLVCCRYVCFWPFGGLGLNR